MSLQKRGPKIEGFIHSTNGDKKKKKIVWAKYIHDERTRDDVSYASSPKEDSYLSSHSWENFTLLSSL